MKILLLLVLSIGVVFLLIFVSFSPITFYLLLFVDIFLWFTLLAFLTLPLYMHPARPRQFTRTPQVTFLSDGLPQIPRTVQEILRTMDHAQFELFSAAVILGLGQGYTFVEHCGGSGDQGIDVKLLNVNGLRVMVQCKEYTGGPVESSEVRDFSGALTYWNAVYGFFVTTSTFSKGAQEIINANPSRIRAIDKEKLEMYLQQRPREIAQAWREVQESVNKIAV